MLELAWWTCVLAAMVVPAPGGARVLARCELARELRRLGVRADHVPTWVCIAFHESRIDTAARNPHSGDHGLLQISELYWCGAGKACGLPCAALRDDDIADDVACALRVHDEHTRLQGDGFLAWVVYPQHCKQNTKKYLADCSDSLKDITTVNPMENLRTYSDSDLKINFTVKFNPNIDDLKPFSFSSFSSTGHNINNLENINVGKDDRFKWQHARLSNIDELSLPVFDLMTKAVSNSSFPALTTATFAAVLQPLKHIKKIETNQIRKDKLMTVTVHGTTDANTGKPNTTILKTTPIPFSSRSYTHSLATISTTTHPTISTAQKSTKDIIKHSTTTSTTTIRPLTEKTNKYQSLQFRIPKYYNFSDSVTSPRPLNKKSSKETFICHGCRPPSTALAVPNSREKTTHEPQTTLLLQKTARTTENKKHVGIITTTAKTTTTRSTTPNYNSNGSIKNITTNPWRTLSSTTRPVRSGRGDEAPATTTPSILDWYLNTRRPAWTTYKFASPGDSWYRRRIFFDGTTSPATPLHRRQL